MSSYLSISCFNYPSEPLCHSYSHLACSWSNPHRHTGGDTCPPELSRYPGGLRRSVLATSRLHAQQYEAGAPVWPLEGQHLFQWETRQIKGCRLSLQRRHWELLFCTNPDIEGWWSLQLQCVSRWPPHQAMDQAQRAERYQTVGSLGYLRGSDVWCLPGLK